MIPQLKNQAKRRGHRFSPAKGQLGYEQDKQGKYLAKTSRSDHLTQLFFTTDDLTIDFPIVMAQIPKSLGSIFVVLWSPPTCGKRKKTSDLRSWNIDWLVVEPPTPLMDFVSWDDELPTWKVIKFIKIPWFQTTRELNESKPKIWPTKFILDISRDLTAHWKIRSRKRMFCNAHPQATVEKIFQFSCHQKFPEKNPETTAALWFSPANNSIPTSGIADLLEGRAANEDVRRHEVQDRPACPEGRPRGWRYPRIYEYSSQQY